MSKRVEQVAASFWRNNMGTAYTITDRVVQRYRAGELVRLRGLVERAVANGYAAAKRDQKGPPL